MALYFLWGGQRAEILGLTRPDKLKKYMTNLENNLQIKRMIKRMEGKYKLNLKLARGGYNSAPTRRRYDSEIYIFDRPQGYVFDTDRIRVSSTSLYGNDIIVLGKKEYGIDVNHQAYVTPTISRIPKKQLVFTDFKSISPGTSQNLPIACIYANTIHLFITTPDENAPMAKAYIKYVLEKTLPLFTPPKKEAQKDAYKKIEKKLKQLANREKLRAKEKINISQASIKSIVFDLNKRKGELRTARKELKALPNRRETTKRIEKVKKYLSTHPMLKEIKTKENTLHLFTKPLSIHYKKKCFPINKYEIVIDLSDLDTWAYRQKTKKTPTTLYQHCFVNAQGSICWGSNSNDFTTLQRKGDLVGIIELTLMLLQSYDPTEPHIGLAEFIHRITGKLNIDALKVDNRIKILSNEQQINNTLNALGWENNQIADILEDYTRKGQGSAIDYLETLFN